MTNFKTFADQVNANFTALQNKGELFVVQATGDELYDAYLAAFPEGTNPVFRERTEHDCSNCRGFIRNFGGVVSIDPDTLALTTIWGGGSFEAPYDTVAEQMHSFVSGHRIGGLFRVEQPSFSARRTSSQREDGSIESYNHFHGTAERRFVTRDGAQAGEHLTSARVLFDSFEGITLDAVDTVIGLIEDKQLYRGEEHLSKLRAYRAAAVRAQSLSEGLCQRYIAFMAPNMAVSRFKNSVIGTLVVDLSTGGDLEGAVRSFEAKVAPANYQRTSQVVSQRMIDEALKTIDDLGLKVGRRLARLDDVSINNVLWADSATRPLMKDGLAGLLAGAASKKPVTISEKAVTNISIEAFLAEVLPGAQGLKLLVAPDLAGNFMTLTTASEPGGPDLFKWPNPFAWSYAGGVTDSITERVKLAGGNINAALRFSLSWSNSDDLDIHVMFTSTSGRREIIYYGSKQARTPGLVGGLDVDMNAGAGNIASDPVENIAFTSVLPGTYEVVVHNFNKRTSANPGFTLQTADAVGLTNYAYPKTVRGGTKVHCLTATVDAAGNVSYRVSDPDLTRGAVEITGEKWGAAFGQFAEVGSVLLSPNHWDDHAVGNKHYFFLLKDAQADEQPRGIYNEFLHPALSRHRKVLDLIGEKTKPELGGEQLSGIGVSSTLRKSVIVEVSSASARRQFNVQF